MTFSKVAIINLALGNLGARRIDSIDELSPEAEVAATYWDLAVETVLAVHNWNFATKTAALALVGDSDREDWRCKYSLPSDCLVVRKILSSDRNDSAIEYQVQGGFIYTDQEAAVIEYTAIAESTKMRAYFVDALAWQLASRMADALTHDLARRQHCETMYQNTITTARRIDAAEGMVEAVPDPSWIRIRFE